MKLKNCSTKKGEFRYHDGEMIQTHDLGDGTIQVQFVCLRCGLKWWHEYTDHNTMTEYDDDDPRVREED